MHRSLIIMTKTLLLTSMLLSGSVIPMSLDPRSVSTLALEPSTELTLQSEFQAWKQTQKPQDLIDYQAFIKQHLQPTPSLLEMTYNRHRPKNDCEYIQFLIPPRDLWPSLKPALRLLGLLQQQGLATAYQIRSVYRDPSANTCVGGARRSRHVQHAAIDFRVLNIEPTDAAHQALDQQYCRFWRKYGEQYQMGLGVYGSGRYHVDGTGYRTWGSNYKRTTSPC